MPIDPVGDSGERVPWARDGIPPQGILDGDDEHREGSGMVGYAMNREELLARLRRIEGQVRGLQRMVEDDKYCIDVLTQVNSATAALKAVGLGLLDEHVRHCVKDSIEQGAGDQKVEELLAAVARFAGK
jgi:CsoR family transcriptional regulator, copper-sensing transcriptional repressor